MDQGAAGSNKRNGDKRDQIDQEQTDDKIENQITKCQKKIETLDVLGDALTTILATDLDIANSVDVTLKNGAL